MCCLLPKIKKSVVDRFSKSRSQRTSVSSSTNSDNKTEQRQLVKGFLQNTLDACKVSQLYQNLPKRQRKAHAKQKIQ